MLRTPEPTLLNFRSTLSDRPSTLVDLPAVSIQTTFYDRQPIPARPDIRPCRVSSVRYTREVSPSNLKECCTGVVRFSPSFTHRKNTRLEYSLYCREDGMRLPTSSVFRGESEVLSPASEVVRYPPYSSSVVLEQRRL